MDIPPTAVRVQTCVLQCGCAHAGSVHNVRRSVRTHGAHLGRQVVVGLARPAHGLRRHLGGVPLPPLERRSRACSESCRRTPPSRVHKPTPVAVQNLRWPPNHGALGRSQYPIFIIYTIFLKMIFFQYS